MNAESQRQNVIQTNFDLRSGRQVNTDKVVVPGFPNGLPNGVPEGVKIALASAQRGILQWYVFLKLFIKLLVCIKSFQTLQQLIYILF